MWVSERLNAQHCRLAMVEKWRKTLDGGGETGAVLADLSKAFDCINHNLLIAELNVYGFEKQSINFIYSYLTKRKQRTKNKLCGHFMGNVIFRCTSRLRFRTTFIQYIYIYL